MRKEVMLAYAVVVLIFVGLVGSLFFIRVSLTGFAVFEQDEVGEFDEGTYQNTEWNGSAVVLSSGETAGNYTSKVFDAGNDASWNNISWYGNESDIEFLYGVDGGGDIYKSSDLGINWILSQEDFGRTTSTTDMFSNLNYLYILSSTGNEVWNSSDGTGFTLEYADFDGKSPYVGDSDNNGNLYVITGNGETWMSSDNGESWSLQGDFNGGSTNNPKGIAIDSNGYVFAVGSAGKVFKSTDSGQNWEKVCEDYGGSTNTDGMDEDSNDNLYILLNTKIYKSEDAGVNWGVINDSISPYANNLLQLLIDNNDNFFVLDAIGRVFKSIDLGINWQEIGDCNNEAMNDPKGITDFTQSTNLSFYVRSCDDVSCSSESWVEVTDILNLGLGNNRYFQYRVEFESPDSSVTSILESVGTDYNLLDEISPDVSFLAQTTEEGEYNQESIFVGVDVSDENDVYSFINFDNSLNAFYKLNDTGAAMKDYSANGYDGTISGASSTRGKFGDALNFDGTDTADCAGAGNFERTDNFSVSVWVKSEPLAKGIIQRYDGTKGWSLFTTASGMLVLDIRHDGSKYIRRRSVNTVTDTTWKHIVFTYDGSSTLAGTHVYIDGELDDSASSNSDTLDDSISTGVSCKLGILHNYGNYCWIGEIDEVLIFNRVLSSDEISALYNATSYSNNFTDLSESSYDFYAYAQDIYSNENQTGTRTVSLVDNVAPTISLVEPQAKLYTSNESLSLNFSVSDSDGNLNSCWYNFDNGENITLENCQNITFNVSGDGIYVLTIYADDSEGLESNDSVEFNVDVTGISASVSEPSGTKISRTGVPITYNVIGNNLTCWYNVKTSIGGDVISNTTIENCSSSNFDVSSDGDYVFNLYLNNSLGSSAFDNSNFSVDTFVEPPVDDGGTGGTGGGGSSVPKPKTIFSFSDLGEIVMHPGETKTLSLKVRNTGKVMQNNCKISGSGASSGWVSSSDEKDLNVNEEAEFVFVVKIPKNTEIKDDNISLNLKCQDSGESTNLKLSIVKGGLDLSIKEVSEIKKGKISFTYILRELSGNYQNVEVGFLIVDKGGATIAEGSDVVSLNTDEVKERIVEIEIPLGIIGEYDLVVKAISGELVIGDETSVLVGGTGVTGFASFFNFSPNAKKYISMIIIVLIGGFLAFLVIKRINKTHKSYTSRKGTVKMNLS